LQSAAGLDGRSGAGTHETDGTLDVNANWKVRAPTVEQIPSDVQTCLSVIISAGEILESYFDRLSAQQRRIALEDLLGAARRMDDWMQELTAPQLVETGKRTIRSRTSALPGKDKPARARRYPADAQAHVRHNGR